MRWIGPEGSVADRTGSPPLTLVDDQTIAGALSGVWTVPAGEVWDLLSVALENASSAAAVVNATVAPPTGTSVRVLSARNDVAGVASVVHFPQGLLLLSGAAIGYAVANVGVNDRKVASILFRRGFAR